ncbi:MazG-like family protein [Streptomyces sp. NRRL B-11253]|uniref:MazG-like family protein n=1 Tax=Streptomyces sp. NRRL B-11253 TaxID=1463826 RepID=UPI000A6279D0|nr:MazG-like family protein [Streptomyces sp. NRRL B-11253]
MSISEALATLSGGDLPADAVRENRCLKPPIGCGKPLISEDGTARVFWNEDEAGQYEAEWRITGLCPDCQDAVEDGEAEPASMWPTIRGFVAWLDDANGRVEGELALRIMKIGEEFGEAAQAYIGMTGQNPRKGVTHTAADVADELCDVAITALTALASVVDNPEAVFAANLGRVQQRVNELEARRG